ncbi:MAG TPA: hypothetical protein VGQ83_15115 [Polyangia bacterium]|jgi:hypothetical protein
MSQDCLRACVVVALLVLGSPGCGDGSGGGGLGALDPRCDALCAESDPACASAVTECQSVCQVRVAGLASLCATCLLEGANGGTCGGGGPCCPAPEFPASVRACADACAGSAGVNPAGDHPLCEALCADDDAACSADSAACFDECRVRIQGVSGLCALCLLEGAQNGACNAGAPCCPSPDFPTTVADCADVCGG